MDHIDLNLFSFDHDLTMAIVLAHPDGTVYHRYGGRSHISRMNMGTLVDLMKEGLSTHRAYLKAPSPPEPQPPRYLPQLINERLRGRIKPVYGCFHCHYAREARQYLALEAGEWTPDQFWIWPLPERIGLVMNQGQQYKVEKVIPNSAADDAGVEAGDLLQRLGGVRVLTQYDIQWILDQRPDTAGPMSYALLRQGRLLKGSLELESGWKVGDPKDYSWRVRNVFTEHMVKFLPTPGLTGEPLSDSDLASSGLEPNRFAIRVTQLNYGTFLAGVRLGDVILSAGGRSDFATPRDFYHWCERLRRSGRDIRLQLLRGDSDMSLMVSLNYLNYSRVERAPRVALGFIVQELPGDGGLRVGHINDESNAERTGLVIGDRIITVDGEEPRTYDGLMSLLNTKAPGDLLTIRVRRDEEELQFGFVLPGEEETKSDLARLTPGVLEKGQELSCVVSLNLPSGKHIYSVHRQGFGVPTQLEFRGRGYELVGGVREPRPKRRAETGVEVMWVLEGAVEFEQKIRITDPAIFQMVLRVYAQVCDDRSCHEFRSIVSSHGSGTEFRQFRGRFEGQPVIEPQGLP